jgi:sigma-B regulation protein RsbU (phosphoserine phosphatase)
LPYPLLASKAGCSGLGQGGMPSGMFDGTSYEQHSVELQPGDSVLFATDGLHELRNLADDFLNDAELANWWHACREGSADESLNSLFDRARIFSNGNGQHDDVTAVVLKVL